MIGSANPNGLQGGGDLQTTACNNQDPWEMVLPSLRLRLVGQPLALAPIASERLQAVLAHGAVDQRQPAQSSYDLVDGIAIITIEGILVQKLGTLRSWAGMTGYDGIRIAVLEAVADPDVSAIALSIDSPGGETAGLFDLADTIYALRNVKPIHAILNECALGAAYALASAASRVSVPRTGFTGSVGILTMHIDASRLFSKAGLTITTIAHGACKAERDMFGPLSKTAAGRWQAQVDTVGDLFVRTVARNRGLPPNQVKAIEGATLTGQAGVVAGLADFTQSPAQAWSGLVTIARHRLA